MKYIYLIQSLENGYYKIGVSKHPQKRMKQLQTGNSSQLKLIETYLSNRAHQIEKTIQRRFSHNRMEGEWFELSIENEINFVNECKQIDETLDFLEENNNAFI